LKFISKCFWEKFLEICFRNLTRKNPQIFGEQKLWSIFLGKKLLDFDQNAKVFLEIDFRIFLGKKLLKFVSETFQKINLKNIRKKSYGAFLVKK
jgi:hypothetical protein